MARTMDHTNHALASGTCGMGYDAHLSVGAPGAEYRLDGRTTARVRIRNLGEVLDCRHRYPPECGKLAV